MSEFDGLELPKLVIHTLCGEPLFYYFGTHEDAKVLRNFNDLGTLEGDGVTPKDIVACKNCGERIRTDQLQVVDHERKTYTLLKENKSSMDDTVKQVIEKRIKQIEEKMMKDQKIFKKPPHKDDSFWNDLDDTFRVRKDKKE